MATGDEVVLFRRYETWLSWRGLLKKLNCFSFFFFFFFLVHFLSHNFPLTLLKFITYKKKDHVCFLYFSLRKKYRNYNWRNTSYFSGLHVSAHLWCEFTFTFFHIFLLLYSVPPICFLTDSNHSPHKTRGEHKKLSECGEVNWTTSTVLCLLCVRQSRRTDE